MSNTSDMLSSSLDIVKEEPSCKGDIAAEVFMPDMTGIESRSTTINIVARSSCMPCRCTSSSLSYQITSIEQLCAD